ncbi:hypothetical protein [Aquimarina sp. U1-2]|uniref:hypothetical protein n=1 Tax=Aquimarina sp. U1-2 TaxID=2823141 RepID=UPI001FEF801A|nr:hypothetical protein [Aquimarina sp. U1-2]
MKKLFAICALTIFLSCEDELNRLTVFEVDDTTEFTIPSSTIIEIPDNIGTPSITTNSQSEFENNNTNSNAIESVTLKSLRLTIQSPEDGNFNFLQEVHIFIKADGLEEQELAFAENIENTNANVLDLQTTGVELKEYVKRDSYSLRINTTTDETINQNHDIQVYSVFRVDAEILGI